MKRALVILVGLAVAGCGAPVQRAQVLAPGRDGTAPRALVASRDTTADVATGRWVVTPARSRLSIKAGTALVGHHVFTFRRFRANVTGDGATTFRSEVDTASLEGGLPGMASFARDRLLETDVYPRATFDGVARRVGSTNEVAIEGTLDLHGVVRTLRFTGTLDEEADALHLLATFELPRKPFNIQLAGALDTFMPDDVEVTLDIRAQREHVSVEELPP